jgi:hypothetical protein
MTGKVKMSLTFKFGHAEAAEDESSGYKAAPDKSG